MRSILFLIGILLLSACSMSQVGPPSGSSSSTASEPTDSSSSEASETNGAPTERETHNVTYRGIVQPAGISIYMQGSHRLLLSDGRSMLLESEEVEVSGSTRPTVEANGIIMRVEKTKLILPAPEEESSLSSSSINFSIEQASSQESSTAVVSAVSNTSQPLESSEPTEKDSALRATIEAMATEKISAENWTQEYCSSHIGFCLPVHRNWWYKSFGTTTTMLWHVEVGNSPVLNLGDGPVSINLISGDLFLENQETTNVQVHGDTVVASRPWSGDRHFEIRADSTLESAVRYMIEHINPYEGN